MLFYTLVTLPVVLLIIWAAVKFRSWRSVRPGDLEVHHCNCPKCKRRFGYRARQAGHKACCPRCGQNFVFPQLPVKVPGRR
jgi:hypothetical protein